VPSASCALLLSLAQISLAQSAAGKPAAETPAVMLKLTVEKAQALESRGRPDMAVQLWQQVLASDPKNIDALVGMARDLKLTGSDQAIDALDRLRKASPKNPDIPKIEGLPSTHAESAFLRKAADLARQGQNDDAMRIYTQLYGDRPPDSDTALAYYQTLYGTAKGKPEAIAGMRGLTTRNPNDPRFSIELGVMLADSPPTRGEAIRLLKAHPQDATAQTVLRQALVQESTNPESASQLRDYLKDHPQDAELAAHLKENEAKLAQMNIGIARTPAEHAAFADLDAHRLESADQRFTAILADEPDNGRAAAGLGLLRVEQNNFADAVNYLTRAESNGLKERIVEDALATARFRLAMSEATAALNANQPDQAAANFRHALELRPRSPEALNALAGLLLDRQQYAAAAPIYDQLTKVQPDSINGWRGLFFSYALGKQNAQALAVEDRIPSSVKAALAKDPEYLGTLAAIDRAEDRTDDAQRVLAEALALSAPNNGAALKPAARLEYASLLMQGKRYGQAATLYSQILADDPASLPAWTGLVSAHHELSQDTQAIADLKKMPPAACASALADQDFLTLFAAIYQKAGQIDVAQAMLEREAKRQIAAGGHANPALEVELAQIDLARNDAARAVDIDRQVLKTNPENAAAWKSLLTALEAANRNAEAFEQLQAIPTAVRRQLDADFDFVLIAAAVETATGDTGSAAQLMNRLQAHYVKLRIEPPASVEIQNALLLLNAGNDRGLYPALLKLGGRPSLTPAQRDAVQEIWAKWAVRRATADLGSGSARRAIDILEAAAQAFSGNLTVRKAIAAAYTQVGRAGEAMAIYKTIPVDNLTASDFQDAVNAAFEAGELNQAGLWLRQALQRFPQDAAILSRAARYEEARGDNRAAANFDRAAQAAMRAPRSTAVSAGQSPDQSNDRVEHVLVYPDQDTNTHRAGTAADLARLLDPDNAPFARVTIISAPPASAPDSFDVARPAVVTPGQQAPAPAAPKPDAPRIFPPPVSQVRTQPAPVYVPQS
jgi:tetratricopeptide (TPR) repeat protein